MKVPHATECIRGQRGPQVIRIGRSPLRKAPAGRFGPTRIFRSGGAVRRDLSGTCFHCAVALLAAGLYPAPAHASGHTPQRQVFIRHLRPLRGTLLSGRSSSGTCACFGAHSSAAGLHPAPAPASRHTPQRTLIAASRRRGLAAAAEYLPEREADAVAEAGDGRGVSRHPACGIARVRPKNAGTMPLRQNGREASGNECGRGLCVLLQSLRISRPNGCRAEKPDGKYPRTPLRPDALSGFRSSQ